MLRSAFAAGRGRLWLGGQATYRNKTWIPLSTSTLSAHKKKKEVAAAAAARSLAHSSHSTTFSTNLWGVQGTKQFAGRHNTTTIMLGMKKSQQNWNPQEISMMNRGQGRFNQLNTPPLWMCSNTTTNASALRMTRYKSVRWLNTADGKKGDGKEKTDPAINTTQKEGAKEEAKEESKAAESLDPRAFLLGTREHLRKVADFEIGDMLATYSIVVLLAAILLSPIVGQYMRGSESTYDELDTDDQIVDLARIFRRDFMDKVDGSNLEDKGVVDAVLADVLSSKALQEQAIKFVVSIVQSEQVKAACQKLLKDLWNDLVKDPETTAQIIFVLNMAIQNDDIRLAVKKLVLEIVEDEEVLEELVRLLQKLGHDQEVLDATKTLLTESAHNALNDPEILDHSMEFATDVVGDDVVQRTAGEALRNTVSYAVQPGISILLAATGVGLLFFSIMSLGYARSSEKEAKVLDEAVSGLARSLQPHPKLYDRLWNVLSLPFRVVGAAASAVFTTVLYPIHFVQYTIARIDYTSSAATKAVQVSTTWTVEKLAALSSTACSIGNAIGNGFFGFLAYVSNACQSVVSFLTGLKSSTGDSVELIHQQYSSLSRAASTRAWVSLDAVSQWLVTLQGWLGSFSQFVTGVDHNKLSKE